MCAGRTTFHPLVERFCEFDADRVKVALTDSRGAIAALKISHDTRSEFERSQLFAFARSGRRLRRRRQSRALHRPVRQSARGKAARLIAVHAEDDGPPGLCAGRSARSSIFTVIFDPGAVKSQQLEAECHRNIEVIWLLRTLKPDFKTIADFRSENRAAFKAVLPQFALVVQRPQAFRARVAGRGWHAHQGGQ